MKKALLLFSVTLSFLVPAQIGAQNLLRNPGFEDSLQCPSGSGAFVNYVDVWTKPSWGSADYFYAGCPISPSDETPRTGNAYGGIIVYDPANIREYMTGHLSSPLVAGTTYSVSFWVSLNDASMEAINEIGAYFSSTSVYYNNANPIILTPQVQGSTPYTMKTGWQQVSGSFTATGGEQYMIIGCFLPDSLMTFTTVSTTGWGDVYYFVDDVCVAAEMEVCDAITAVPQENIAPSFTLFPNPATESTTLTFPHNRGDNYTLQLFDSRGQLLRTTANITNGRVEIERDGLANGMYFFRLECGEKSVPGKLVWE